MTKSRSHPENPPGRQHRRAIAASRPAFSLIELLVVILIIALVMAILIPAIAGVRRSAKNVQTTTLLNGLAAAAGSFVTDKGQLPGFFSPAEMGNSENNTRGMSAMQNIMLDLAGGVTSSPASANVITVGPRSSRTANVDLAIIGVTNGTGSAKAYFNPDRSFYNVDTGRAGIGQVGDPANLQLPSLVDAFGTPILAWAKDDRQGTKFAATTSDSEPARFYWASNAGFLKSTALGAKATSQIWVNGSACSMLGDGVGQSQIEGTLQALLGDPTNPVKNYNDNANRKAGGARAPMVFQSAGPDGYFLGSFDTGGKGAGGSANTVLYTRDVDTVRPPFFDDVIVTAGK